MKTLVGFHSIKSRLRQQPRTIKEIYVDAARDDARMRELRAAAEKLSVRVIAVDAKRLDGLAGGVRYQLGGRVRVKVVRVDIETSKIDFVLVEAPGAVLPAGERGPPVMGHRGPPVPVIALRGAKGKPRDQDKKQKKQQTRATDGGRGKKPVHKPKNKR